MAHMRGLEEHALQLGKIRGDALGNKQRLRILCIRMKQGHVMCHDPCAAGGVKRNAAELNQSFAQEDVVRIDKIRLAERSAFRNHQGQAAGFPAADGGDGEIEHLHPAAGAAAVRQTQERGLHENAVGLDFYARELLARSAAAAHEGEHERLGKAFAAEFSDERLFG